MPGASSRLRSQLLRDMERPVGGRTIDPGMFRQLFLQRLPRNVVMVLEATSASVDLATQAEIADKFMELNGPPSFGRTVSAVRAPPVSSVSADVAALCAITTDALEMQHGSALHLVRIHPPPHQPPNLRETPRQELMATRPPGFPPSSGRRLFITDRRTGVRFLVDTGAEVSVLPTPRQDRTRHHSPSSPPLTAVKK